MSAAVPIHMDATLRVRHALTRGLESQIAGLRRQRLSRRLGEVLFFAALWAAGIAIGLAGLAATGSAAWVLRLSGILASAAALNAFYLLSHEGHHRLLFHGPIANHVTNIILCVPLLHSPTAYRVLHDLHHRYLGGPGDPDEYRNYTGDARLRWTLQWVRLTLGTLVYMPLIPVVAWRRAAPADRWRIGLEYACMIALWVPIFIVVPMRVLLQAWLIPGVVVGYISAVRALAQHALTASNDPLLASRSVRSNPVVSFFLLYENYHLEHHLFPEVPSYHLPRLRALLHARLPRTVEARSYSRFLAGFAGRSVRGDESPMGLMRKPVVCDEVEG